MNHKSIIFMVGVIAVSSGCDNVTNSYEHRAVGPNVVYSAYHYEYPFGFFAGRVSDEPEVEYAKFNHETNKWPVIWIGDESLDLQHETAKSLEERFGEQFRPIPYENGCQLTDVTNYNYDIYFNNEGKVAKVCAMLKPRLSLTADSEVLTLPCTPAELEKCFGKPDRVTEHR